MASRQKEVKELLRQVQRQGGRVVEGRKKYKVYGGDGSGPAIISKTPSARNWRNRAKADLRRLGLHV